MIHDPVNHPSHYTSHPSGIECIDVVEHYPFNVGAAIKYLWRAGLKDDAIEDLKKAEWYCKREQKRRLKYGTERRKVPALTGTKFVDAHCERLAEREAKQVE